MSPPLVLLMSDDDDANGVFIILVVIDAAQSGFIVDSTVVVEEGCTNEAVIDLSELKSLLDPEISCKLLVEPVFLSSLLF